jgi:uncharacterized protein YndB with AHSA1/START domain
MNATSTTPAARPFLITRTFDVPREALWKAWTDPEIFKKWFGPKGSTVSDGKLDIRPGGTGHFCVHAPDGRELWGKFIYQEISRPERLVYRQHFSDREGGLSRHPMVPTWPLQMLTTVTLTEEGKKTTLTVRWEPINPTDEERKTFDGAHEGMKQGWGGSFDQLAENLAKG